MKKLTCHCGAIEAEVKIPIGGVEKDHALQLFNLQKKRLHYRSAWS